MNPHRGGDHRFTPLGLSQNGVHQPGHGLFIKSERRHIPHRTTDRQCQFPRRFSHRRIIQAHRKTITASTANMAAPAGEPVNQTFPRFDLPDVAKGKPGVLPSPHSGMGNVFPFRRRIAPMAAAAPSPLRIVDGMASQAELAGLPAAPGGGNRSQENADQKPSDQLLPLKNIATTVSSTIAAASSRVTAETVR